MKVMEEAKRKEVIRRKIAADDRLAPNDQCVIGHLFKVVYWKKKRRNRRGRSRRTSTSSRKWKKGRKIEEKRMQRRSIEEKYT